MRNLSDETVIRKLNLGFLDVSTERIKKTNQDGIQKEKGVIGLVKYIYTVPFSLMFLIIITVNSIAIVNK